MAARVGMVVRDGTAEAGVAGKVGRVAGRGTAVVVGIAL
jgi:hypothetical protein